MNAELDLDNERIIYKKAINIAWLWIPKMVWLFQLSAMRIKDLSQLARESPIWQKKPERKLNLSDLKDGTFSITSYGSIGGYFAVPVINYPQSAILGIGRIADKPVIKDNAVVPGKVMPISMSVDHRIVDGGEVARFLNEVLSMLKEPLLIWAKEGGEA
jgi:pyruvate dehydrogenase E2 component (dihydrolipoamide acetyltransferase)